MMGDLRLSVIDQCNLRCRYCMPEEHYTWLPRQDLLSVKEISAIVDVFLSVGVSKVRITGGEPLIRPDLPEIVRTLSAKVGEDSGLRDLAITTNGVLLADRVDGLKAAGMKRITVSLDTLQPERFKAISQRNSHDKVIAGIKAVAAAGFTDTKIDTTVMRGANHDELADLIEFARTVNAEVRFIEYMDVGGATHWAWEKVFTKANMLESLEKRYGRIEPLPKHDTAAVSGPEQGGIVIFVGNVRDHNAGHDVTRLFYEAYPPMVIRTLMSIIGRCEDKAEGVRVAVAHRTGELQIGDAAVVIGASAPHRAEAFDAARMCIELLKQEVPIWKKEFSSTGAEWVGDRP